MNAITPSSYLPDLGVHDTTRFPVSAFLPAPKHVQWCQLGCAVQIPASTNTSRHPTDLSQLHHPWDLVGRLEVQEEQAAEGTLVAAEGTLVAAEATLAAAEGQACLPVAAGVLHLQVCCLVTAFVGQCWHSRSMLRTWTVQARDSV